VSSLGKFPDQYAAEIAAQPEALRRAASGLMDQRAELGRIRDVGNAPGPMVFTGMGASSHACHPAVTALAAGGIPALHVDSAELLYFRRPVLANTSVMVTVSQSGESAEPVALAAELARRRDRPLLVSVTNGLDNTLVRGSDVALDTRAGVETGPSSMTFAAGLVVLSAVPGALAGESPDRGVTRLRAAAERAAAAAEGLLAHGVELADTLLGWLGGREIAVLLGRGPARAASELGALVLKESAAFAAESLETAQFRHGPLELAGPGLAAVVVATEAETRLLDLRLARELASTGAAVLVVSSDGTAPPGALGVATGELERTVAPAVSVVPVQLLGWRLAMARGRSPGAFVHATKVTARE